MTTPESSRPPGWLGSDLHARRGDIARAAGLLLLHPRLWTIGRREELVVLSDTRIRREAMVTVAVPAFAHPLLTLGSESDGSTPTILPLSVLTKDPVRGLSVTDTDGSALPMLSDWQRDTLAAAILLEAANGVLDEDLDSELEVELHRLAVAPEAEAAAVLDRFPIGQGLPSDAQRVALWKERRWRMLAADLVENFVLFAVVTVAAGELRTVKLRYEDELVTPRPSWRVRLGWRTVPCTITAFAAAHSATYEAELEAPGQLVASDAELVDAATGRVLSSEPSTVERAHLRARDLARNVTAVVRVSFALEPGGLLAAAVAIGWLTTILLGLGAGFSEGVGRNTEVATAVAVALPALFAAYLIRPGEHGLVKRLYSGLRGLLAALGLLSFTAAVSLTVGASDCVRLFLWASLSVFSLGCSLALSRTYLVARRMGSTLEDA